MSYVADKFILSYNIPVVCVGNLSLFTFQNTGANTAVIQVSNDGVDYTDLLSLDSGAEKTVYNAYTYLKLASETTVFVSRGNVIGNGSVTLDSDNDVTTQQIQGLNERITTLESKPVLTETKVSELINTAVGNLAVPLSSNDVQGMINTSIGNIPIGLPEEEVRNLITGATSNLVSHSHFEDVLANYLVTEQIETKINSAVASKADTATVTNIQNENMEAITSLQNSLNTISNSLLTEKRVIELINQNKQFKDDQANWLKNFILKNVDYDKDGLTDYDEIYIHKTSALKADTDDDGMSDKYEIDRGTDPKVFTPRTTATITQFHTATRSKSNANILNVYAITDTTNTTHIEPVTVVVTSVDNSSFTATKVLSDLMFAGQTVLIPVNPVEWLRESVPNHTLTGSKFIRYSLTSQSGLNFHNGSGAFTF